MTHIASDSQRKTLLVTIDNQHGSRVDIILIQFASVCEVSLDSFTIQQDWHDALVYLNIDFL